jgi:uncharacterized RDD family membrane protein YckC
VETVENTASWVRRLVALAVDWAACSLVTLVLLGPGGYSNNPYSGWVTLGVFWLESAVGVALAGGSFGQLAARVRVLRLDGRPVPLLLALVRQLLVCLPDGRGLHDLAAGTAAFNLVAAKE